MPIIQIFHFAPRIEPYFYQYSQAAWKSSRFIEASAVLFHPFKQHCYVLVKGHHLFFNLAETSFSRISDQRKWLATSTSTIRSNISRTIIISCTLATRKRQENFYFKLPPEIYLHTRLALKDLLPENFLDTGDHYTFMKWNGTIPYRNLGCSAWILYSCFRTDSGFP